MGRASKTVVLLTVSAAMAVAALGWRSRTRGDVLAIRSPAGHLHALASHRGGIVAFLSAMPFQVEHGGTFDATSASADDLDGPSGTLFDPSAIRRSLLGFKLASGTLAVGAGAPAYHAVRVPHGAVAGVMALAALCLLRAPLRRRRWANQGRCRGCGYDLRGSPGRCPECGRGAGAGDASRQEAVTGIRRRLGVATLAAMALGAAAVLGVARLPALRPAATANEATAVVCAYDAGDLAVAALARHREDSRVVALTPVSNICFPSQAEDHGPDESGDFVDLVGDLWAMDAAVAAGAAVQGAAWGDRVAVVAPGGIQREFARLLQTLRAPAGTAFVTIIADEPAGTRRATQDAEAKLEEVVEELKLHRVTPEAAFVALRDLTRANVVVDWPALEAVGIDRDATGVVTMHVWDLPLAGVLDVLLASVTRDNAFPLGYRVENGVIRVAARAELDSSGATVRIYDVRQLLVDVRTSRRNLRSQLHGSPASRPASPRVDEEGQPTATWELVEELSVFVKEAVLPDSWRDNGGTTGTLREWGGRLLIQQTPEGHRAVEKLLKQLSEEFAKDRASATSPPAPPSTPPPAGGPAPRARG